MSGLGAFIQGAFGGYQFGEQIKDTKRRRTFEDEDREYLKKTRGWAEEDRTRDNAWEDETRDMTREQWGWKREDRTYDTTRRGVLDARADEQWGWTKAEQNRQENERSVLSAIGQGAIDTWNGGSAAPEAAQAAASPKQAQAAPQPQARPTQEPPEVRLARKQAETSRLALVKGMTADGEPITAANRKSVEDSLVESKKVISDWEAQQAAPPPGQEGSPSAEIAAATAPKPQGRGVLGQDGPVKASPAQRERAAQTFMQHYAQTAVPQITQFYAQQGDIEKAQVWENWAKSQQSQALMGSWAKAVHAAAIGDDEGFIDNLSEVYNGFDDGYSVIREKSQFTRDEDGNIVGAELTFQNRQTGEEHTKHVNDVEDLMREGIYALAPEKIFEHMWGELAAAREVDAERRAFEEKILLERVKSGRATPEDREKAIRVAKDALSKSMGFGWSKLSMEEQNALAIQWIKSNQSAAEQLGADPRAGGLGGAFGDVVPPYTGE